MTSNQEKLKSCKEVLNRLKRSSNSMPFKEPVDPIKFNLPDYFEKVKKPMDLSLIKSNLENNKYKTAEEFKEDVLLMFNNCFIYNEEGSYVHKCGKELLRLFNNLYGQLVETKENLEVYLAEIMKPKQRNFIWPFLEPVDNKMVPDYYDVVKNPIDLQTIKEKLQSYATKEDLKRDLDLMIQNCFTYNLPNSEVYDCGLKFKKLIDSIFYEDDGLSDQISELKSKIILLQRELDTLEAKQNKLKNYSLQERIDLAKRVGEMNNPGGLAKIIAKYLKDFDISKEEIEIDLRDLSNQAIEEIEKFVLNDEEEEITV